jgi:alkylated DNA repair dioxygenase AlkB
MHPLPKILHQQGNEALLLFPDFAADWINPLLLHDFFLQEGIALVQNKITVFGKEYNEPRLTQWMGPSYRYSNIQWEATAFSYTIDQWKRQLSELLNFDFNAVLINYYRNGQDSMGKHRDNEPEIDSSCIASLSFGESRSIHFENPSTKQKIKVLLSHGDLLVMLHLQDRWWHSIPKSKKLPFPRINFTFRRIYNHGECSTK